MWETNLNVVFITFILGALAGWYWNNKGEDE